LDEGETKNPTLEQSRNLGRALATLHKLTENYEFPEDDWWGISIPRVLFGLFHNKPFVEKSTPEEIKEVYNKIFDFLSNWKIPENVPKAVLHGEFTFEHVWFKGNEVYRVIDWDPVNRGYMFQDIGVSSIFIWMDASYKHVEEFLKGYQEIRPLTEWEKENIYRIFAFGAGVFLWWFSSDVKKGIFPWEDLKVEIFEEICSNL